MFTLYIKILQLTSDESFLSISIKNYKYNTRQHRIITHDFYYEIIVIFGTKYLEEKKIYK